MDFTNDNSTDVPSQNTTDFTMFTSELPDENIDTHNPKDRSLSYLFVPFSSLAIIAFLTIVVIFLLKRKKRIDRLRHHLMPYYNFAPGEEDDWETELLESEGELAARRDYNSVSVPKPPPSQQIQNI